MKFFLNFKRIVCLFKDSSIVSDVVVGDRSEKSAERLGNCEFRGIRVGSLLFEVCIFKEVCSQSTGAQARQTLC